MTRKTCLALVACVALLSAVSGVSHAQSLRFKLERVFDEVLRLELTGSPGEHGLHFSPDNVASSDKMIKSLATFIGTNISSFPLSSTGATVVFDFSTGVPVRETGNLGPIFSEEGTTLGKGRIIFGYNFTYMRMNKIRGLKVQDMQFTFIHQDVDSGGLGDSPNELDTIDLFMDMELDASILAFYATAGVTDRLDVGVALPLVNARLKADPLASVNSFTFVTNDTANHSYGDDPVAPVLVTRPTPVNDDATGIGDVALRAKLNFHSGERADLAGLLEVRLPTGDEDNFLGSGHTSVKAVLIASRAFGGITPHANLAYNYRDSKLDNDDIELFLGYSQTIGARFTLALDLIGRFEVGSTIDELQFDETATIRRPVGNSEYVQQVELTNLPQADRDHRVDLSLGAKYAPREFLVLLGNAFFPVNDDGLRSDFVTTVGFEFNF